MSRVGIQPISLPEGVEVSVDDTLVKIKGPKGSLEPVLPSGIDVVNESNEIKVNRTSELRAHRELHGLTRSLLSNMVEGVNVGFTKILDVVGVGYRAQQKGKGVTLSVMLSHTVDIDPLPDTSIEVEGNNRIYVRGVDKQSVGQLAAEIRKVRPPNAYTGKGIRYSYEQVRIKPGKSAARE